MNYAYGYRSNGANQTTSGINEIRVTGEGKVLVQPNQANIIVGISTESKELVEAQNENSTITAKVIQALENIGLPREQIKTSEYTIFPQYDFKDGIQIFRNYRVDHRLTVTTSNLDQVGTIVDTAIVAGANSINGVNFSISNPGVYEQQALSLAIGHASSKAVTIANTIQVQLLHPPSLIIEGASVVPVEPFLPQSAMVKGVSTTTLEPGLSEVKAVVTVIFKY